MLMKSKHFLKGWWIDIIYHLQILRDSTFCTTNNLGSNEFISPSVTINDLLDINVVNFIIIGVLFMFTCIHWIFSRIYQDKYKY